MLDKPFFIQILLSYFQISVIHSIKSNENKNESESDLLDPIAPVGICPLPEYLGYSGNKRFIITKLISINNKRDRCTAFPLTN